MKKLIYTLSFVALLGLTSNAQDNKQEQPAPAKKETNGQRTVSETPNPDAKQAGEPKTRMAITKKGVPASKTKDTRETKTTEPKGQPNSTEKH